MLLYSSVRSSRFKREHLFSALLTALFVTSSKICSENILLSSFLIPLLGIKQKDKIRLRQLACVHLSNIGAVGIMRMDMAQKEQHLS
jgi:hypothetical protein